MSAPRLRLPNRRDALTFDLEHEGQRFTATVSFFNTGKIAELFLTSPKIGTGIAALAHDASIIISIALQSGVSVEALAHSVKRNADSTASSLIGSALVALAALEAEGR